MRGKQQNNKNLAMALPGKVVVRVSQGSFSLLSLGNNQERSTHQQNFLSLFYFSPDSRHSKDNSDIHHERGHLSLSLIL